MFLDRLFDRLLCLAGCHSQYVRWQGEQYLYLRCRRAGCDRVWTEAL